jgi:beta-lactamase regulating signal transducer with metallopeptidase domain
MLVGIGLAAVAPYRVAESPAVASNASTAAPVTYTVDASASWRSFAERTVATVRELLDVPLASSAGALGRALPASADRVVIGVWLSMTALLAMIALLVHVRFSRAVRRWPIAEMHGTRVRLSPSTGPVVIGLAQPEIVVPRWMLDRSPSEQRVVLDHEAEHIRARDALVLAGACVAVVVMPWSPAMWYMLSRVRLAVELDCDARVLRGGVGAKAYGTLLIDLAEQALPLRFTAAALADDMSHLHKRIIAMKPQVPRFAFLRGSAAALIGLAGLLAACEAKLPTESDIKQMDAGSAEQRARQLSLVGVRDSVRYLIDGSVASELAAKGLQPEQIDAIDVAKSRDGSGPATISIRTTNGRLMPFTTRQHDSIEVSGRGLILRSQATTAATPMYIVDGVRTDQATFAKLERDKIAAVEVVKGKAAAATYGPDAEHGVIVVTTKK